MNTDFQLIDSKWDRVFDDALVRDHSQLRLVCPFIKRSVAERLLRLGRPKPLQVITRFDLRDFCNMVSDTSALRLLLESGAEIRGVRNLHAKLYLFGRSRVIVTSANLTRAALFKNHEFGIVADGRKVISRCREYFDKLWQQVPPDLTIIRIDEWEKRLNSLLASGTRSSLVDGLPDEGVDGGMTVPPIVTPPFIAEASQSFVKFFGDSSNREDHTTLVFDEVERSGCHWACTYPKKKRPRQVKDGDVIFMGRLVEKPDDILIYGRAVGMSHMEGRDDATVADIALRPWRKKWPHYIRVHHAEFLAGQLRNGVSLNKLMAELKSDAFESTQKNAVSGNGNTNPRNAYKQQPAVKLSDEGCNWLNSRLEIAFQKHGKLAPEELEQLDWPDL